MGMTPAKWQEFINKSRMTKTADMTPRQQKIVDNANRRMNRLQANKPNYEARHQANVVRHQANSMNAENNQQRVQSNMRFYHKPGPNATAQDWQNYAQKVEMHPDMAKGVHDEASFNRGANWNPTAQTTDKPFTALDAVKTVPRGFAGAGTNFGRMLEYPLQAIAYTEAPVLGLAGAMEAKQWRDGHPFLNPLSKNDWNLWWEGTKGAFNGVTQGGSDLRQGFNDFEQMTADALPYDDPNSVPGALMEGAVRTGAEAATGFGMTKYAPQFSKAFNPAEWKVVQKGLNKGLQAAGDTLNTWWPQAGEKVVPAVGRFIEAEGTPLVSTLRGIANKSLGKEYSPNLPDQAAYWLTEGLKSGVNTVTDNTSPYYQTEAVPVQIAGTNFTTRDIQTAAQDFLSSGAYQPPAGEERTDAREPQSISRDVNQLQQPQGARETTYRYPLPMSVIPNFGF